MNDKRKMNRRRLLELGATSAATAGLAHLFAREALSSEEGIGSAEVPPEDRKLLFVFCAYGGASIIDSFLPIAESEVGDSDLASTLNVFPDDLIGQPSGSKIRYVKLLPSYSFYAPPPEMAALVKNHGDDMVVVPHNVSSVNHTIGQQRSLSGAGVHRGRTIMEEVALRYGMGLPLPNCNMAVDGYVLHGADESIPESTRHEIIAAPRLFAAGTHGYRGLLDVPRESAIVSARDVRAKLDARSAFGHTFRKSELVQKYLSKRDESGLSLEKANMIEKLLLMDTSKVDEKYGVEISPEVARLRELLPHMDEDNAEAQLGLGFLLAYHGLTSSISMGHKPDPVILGDGSIIGTPIAFDFSHNMHRIVQNIMWGRTASLVDQLITLLKSHDYMGDPELGKMWDRSLIYIATEFGRDKQRPKEASSWGTGHHMNNGSVLISPLLKGNAVYGGVDATTGLTYGFDPETGKPDKSRNLFEKDIYSLIAHAMDIEFPGRVDFPSVVRT